MSQKTTISQPKPRRSPRPTLQNLNPFFHKREKTEDDQILTKALLKTAHTTGNLNLHGRGLATVPEKVYNINENTEPVEVNLETLVNEEEAWWNQLPLSNLDLSSNSITELSPKIANLFALTTLTLHDNALTALPKEIGQVEKLQRVNLSRNKLKCLPLEFYTLPNLRYLNISYNEFEEIHPSVSDLNMLEILDASNNNLKSLPNGIGFLVRVTQLLLSNNHIKSLPEDLVNMRSLQKLDLMHNDLKSLPEDMSPLRRLQFLYVQHNDLPELPIFDDSNQLQELHASNNFIKDISEAFCSPLQHLKILDLRDNKIVIIPKEIALLQNLTRLDISNNSINNLPYSLALLAHLISLQVEGNPIKSIRRDILQCGTSRILKTLRDRAQTNASTENSLQSDQMAGDGLNSPRKLGGANHEQIIFPDRYQLRKTRCMSVTKHNISVVPNEIFNDAVAENVNIIDFSKNALSTLPNGLQLTCHCATELIFANNILQSIPVFISQFTQLKLINFSGNQLKDLPKEFGVLNTLRELNINNNRFEAIPPCVYDLKSLEILLARNNLIKDIDPTENGLGKMNRLATLDLGNNNITHVPPILGRLTNITALDLVGNPFRNPRHQVLEKGTDSVMAYLRNRIPN